METPDWKGNKLKSPLEAGKLVFDMARVGLATLIGNIAEYPSRIDTKLANKINEDEIDY